MPTNSRWDLIQGFKIYYDWKIGILVAHIEGGTWLRVFKNRVLRRTFGPKKNLKKEVEKLHNEELNPYPANVENMVSS